MASGIARGCVDKTAVAAAAAAAAAATAKPPEMAAMLQLIY